MSSQQLENAQTAVIIRDVVTRDGVDCFVLAVPHTDYELRARCPEPGGCSADMVGDRVRGVFEAEALRIHGASGGGRFIEPVMGEPRIVAGVVRAIDDEGGRVLVDVAVPMWLRFDEAQDRSLLEIGGLVNCYVRDTTFSVES